MLDSLREDVLYGYEQNQTGIWCGSACRWRRCAPRLRPESCLTHTVTHTGKRADGNNGTNRLRPHPFWTKNRWKALYCKGWKALRRLVRMRSAVRIRPAAPTKPCNRNGYGVLCISDKASKTRKFAKKSAKLFLSASKFANCRG